MSVFISSVAGAAAQFFDNSGNVLTGGKLYTYLAGTTTFADTYTSSTGTVLNTNPIILDSAGRVPEEIWFAENQTYKFVLTDADDVLLGTWDNLVSVNEIVDGYITTAMLADGAVTTVKIADANVTTSKIAALNITTALIADSNVTTAKIADLNVTTGKLADNAVTTIKITDSNVTTAKIADANVTTIKIADANVTTDKIADANVTSAKLARPYTAATAQALTGSSVTFSGIPSWVTKINISFSAAATASAASMYLEIGPSSGITLAPYYSSSTWSSNDNVETFQATNRFIIDEFNTQSVTRSGILTLGNIADGAWAYSGNCTSNYNASTGSDGAISVSAGECDMGLAILAQVKISTSSTFTAGEINISYQ